MLQAHGATPGTASKAATAVGPRASAPPDVVELGHVGPDDPAGDAVRAHIAKHVRRFLLQDVRVRRDLPDSVHQMRVAARRLRSGLRGFGPLVDPDWAKHLRDELGWIAGELGAVRDTEVMIKRLDERAAYLPPDESFLAQTAVDKTLNARITDAREHALGAMRSERHRQLLIDLVDAANSPQLTAAATEPCFDALPPLVEKTWKRLAKDVKALHLDSPAYPWHETRIAAKKARYAAEAVEPVFGKHVKELVKALEEVTEILGDHQDAHVAQMTLKSLAAEADIDAPTGFALGLLYALEVDYEMALRREFRTCGPGSRRPTRKPTSSDGRPCHPGSRGHRAPTRFTRSKVLLIHRPRHKDWSLPKGKLDKGEHLLAAAVRECDEETGIVPVLGPFARSAALPGDGPAQDRRLLGGHAGRGQRVHA